ncbi:2-C-methyl-D-erythritol 4-phosphate cytidylyltransferase [Candidatus Bariatricus faecipullorum]
MMKRQHTVAIVLAAGQGKRMGTKIQKQYLEIAGRPVLFYSLAVFQNSPLIDEIILVTGEGQEEYCKKEIVEKYSFTKVGKIVTGGKERYESVYHALCAVERTEGIVFIHDGARPFAEEEILERTLRDAEKYHACVAAMPVKDTIKIADGEDFAKETPDRRSLWMIQTPQVFEIPLIKEAYTRLMQRPEEEIQVTDDAMVAEQILGTRVKLTEGSYRNIKITTPDDLPVAELYVKQMREKR